MQCFFDYANKGEKVVGNVMVLHGGNLDIDIKVNDPFNQLLFESSRKSVESFQFHAQQNGQYWLCLSNQFSTLSSKTVVFHLYVGRKLAEKDAAREQHFSSLESTIALMRQGVAEIQTANTYIKGRERRHHATVDSTNRRVVVWRFIQILALLAMAAIKVAYLRGLFEKKRGY